MNKEIEDLLQTKRPFDKSTRPEVDKIDKSDVINSKALNNKVEEGNKDKSRHVHKKSSHSHSHKHNHSHKYSHRHKRS